MRDHYKNGFVINIMVGRSVRRYNEQNLAFLYAALPAGIDIYIQIIRKRFDDGTVASMGAVYKVCTGWMLQFAGMLSGLLFHTILFR